MEPLLTYMMRNTDLNFLVLHSAVLISTAIIGYVVIHVLREIRPFWIYFAATVAFAVAQVFRLSPVGVSICEVRSFI